MPILTTGWAYPPNLLPMNVRLALRKHSVTTWRMPAGKSQAWCSLQVTLCDSCLSAAAVIIRSLVALYKFSAFYLLPSIVGRHIWLLLFIKWQT